MISGDQPAAGRLPEKGLGLALEVLEQVARHHDGVSAADIARAVGASRATVYRVLNALVRDEYLVRRPDFSGFLLGARVLELAAVVDAHRRPAHLGLLDDVRETTGESVHLVAFHRSGLTIIDEDPRHPITDRSAFLADPTRSAPGHLWLVERPAHPVPAGAPSWRATPSHDIVAAIRAACAVRGYAEQIGMLSPDRGCLAVPIADESGTCVGAVALSVPIGRFSVAARHLGDLRRAASALGALTAPHPLVFG